MKILFEKKRLESIQIAKENKDILFDILNKKYMKRSKRHKYNLE